MSWLNRNIDNMIKLPRPLFITHIFSKFLVGVGIGFILAGYFDYNWKLWGWVLIVVAVIIDIPSVYRILRR